MKKLILLLALVFVMCGCEQHVSDYGVVESIELFESTKVSNNYTTKYRVKVSKDFNGLWRDKVYLYTNELYSIGDTIQVTKKN